MTLSAKPAEVLPLRAMGSVSTTLRIKADTGKMKEAVPDTMAIYQVAALVVQLHLVTHNHLDA